MLRDKDRMAPHRRLMAIFIWLGWRQAGADKIFSVTSDLGETLGLDLPQFGLTEMEFRPERRTAQFFQRLFYGLHTALPPFVCHFAARWFLTRILTYLKQISRGLSLPQGVFFGII